MRLWGKCGITIVDHQCPLKYSRERGGEQHCSLLLLRHHNRGAAALHVINQQMAGGNRVSRTVHMEQKGLFIESKHTKPPFRNVHSKQTH